MARKTDSTYDHEMKNAAFRAAFEKERAALEVSEFMAQRMEEQGISVRSLAARSGVSPTVIQGIKSGKRTNIQYSKLKPIVSALGYRISFTKPAAGQ